MEFICPSCGSCRPLSRRGFLCTGVAAALPASASSIAPSAQARPSAAPAPGRPILIKNGRVLSLDHTVGDFESADVLISGSKIAAVGPNLSAPDAETIEASRAIVMPGFIDTHRHMWQAILRNTLSDASVDHYIQIVQLQLGPHYRPEDVYAANLVSALGAIEVGITTILDWSHIQNSPEHTDAAIKALADSGIRAVFAYGSPSNGLADFRDDPRQKYPGDIRRLRPQYFSSSDQLLTLTLASLSGPLEQVVDAWAVAREVGAPITIHVGGGHPVPGLVQNLGDRGALKADTTYIHLQQLDRHGVQDDRRQRRHVLAVRLHRDGHGRRYAPCPKSTRPWTAAFTLDRRGNHGSRRSIHANANGPGAATQQPLDSRTGG